jgi:hypothetical protein
LWYRTKNSEISQKINRYILESKKADMQGGKTMRAGELKRLFPGEQAHIHLHNLKEEI